MAQYTNTRQIHDEDGISLLDIIRFFRLNWKFLGLATVALSTVAIILLLLKPQQYQKQLTVSVKPAPANLLSQSIPAMDVNLAGMLAVQSLGKQKLDKITTRAKYDTSTQAVDLTLQSTDASALAGSIPKVSSQLETQYQKILAQDIETNLTSTELKLKRFQNVLAQLDQQIAQYSSTNVAKVKKIKNDLRLEALEEQRADFFSTIAALKYDQKYLEQAQKNIPQFTEQVMSVQILSESDVRQTRSPMPVVVLAIIVSFMVAVSAAIIRSQIARLKDELSK